MSLRDMTFGPQPCDRCGAPIHTPYHLCYDPDRLVSEVKQLMADAVVLPPAEDPDTDADTEPKDITYLRLRAASSDGAAKAVAYIDALKARLKDQERETQIAVQQGKDAVEVAVRAEMRALRSSLTVVEPAVVSRLRKDIPDLKKMKNWEAVREHEAILGYINALRTEAGFALSFIAGEGYRRCDIPACNCGSWHGGQRTVSDETVWVTCRNCGEQQEDMGRGVACDHCGDPMPDAPKPAPVSATEPDAVRTLREGMRGQHALFNVNQEYVCAVAPLLEHIDALTARLAEAERVTEEQVERACVAVAAANQTPWPTGDVAFDQRIRRRMHTALTAARGGG